MAISAIIFSAFCKNFRRNVCIAHCGAGFGSKNMNPDFYIFLKKKNYFRFIQVHHDSHIKFISNTAGIFL